MQDIERTCKSFILTSFVFLFGSVAMLGLYYYAGYDNIFVQPAEYDDQSVNALSESTNLESLKKVCLFWAQNNDAKSKLIDDVLDQFGTLLHGIIYWTMFLAVFFGYGFVSIVWRLRQSRVDDQIAP